MVFLCLFFGSKNRVIFSKSIAVLPTSSSASRCPTDRPNLCIYAQKMEVPPTEHRKKSEYLDEECFTTTTIYPTFFFKMVVVLVLGLVVAAVVVAVGGICIRQ